MQNVVTQYLSALDQSHPHAAGRQLPLVYVELRKLATQRMAQEEPGQKPQPIALDSSHLSEPVLSRRGSASSDGRQVLHSFCHDRTGNGGV
jgi:hypothetical protein